MSGLIIGKFYENDDWQNSQLLHYWISFCWIGLNNLCSQNFLPISHKNMSTGRFQWTIVASSISLKAPQNSYTYLFVFISSICINKVNACSSVLRKTKPNGSTNFTKNNCDDSVDLSAGRSSVIFPHKRCPGARSTLWTALAVPRDKLIII